MNAADLLEALVAMPSSETETEPILFLAAQARRDGMEPRVDGMGNLIITAGSGMDVLFVGHMDTVAPELPVRREDGTIWGRGAVDAKGCLVAAYETLLGCRDSQEVRFTFVAAVGEETDSRGVRALDVESPDLIVNGEPSGWDGITIGYKGIVRGGFSATGEARHGGHPDPNALDRVFSWWVEARQLLDAGTGFDAVQARLDHIEKEAEHVEGRFPLRLPPAFTTQEARHVLHAAAAEHGIDLTMDEALDAATGDPRSRLAAAFRSAIREQGGTPRILHKTGTSDFNHLAARFPGVPIVAYGPGDSSLDHTPDERLEIAELERSIAVWRQALAQVAPVAVPA